MGPLAGRGMHKAAPSVKQETMQQNGGISGPRGRMPLTEDHGLTHS